MIASNNMIRPPLDLLDHHDQEPLRISFHEEERDLDVSVHLPARENPPQALISEALFTANASLV